MPWKFLLFSGIMAALVYLHFYFSHSQWRRVKGEESTDVDPNYVKREDYFAQSFRRKVTGWLELPSSPASGGGGRTILKGRETISVSPQLRLEAYTRCDEILVVEGDFLCGVSCEISREIYARGTAEIGGGSRLQSIAADRDLTLGDGVTVARWVDSGGQLTLGRGCVVSSRVSAQKAIQLGIGARALSLFAPEVASEVPKGGSGHAYLPFVLQTVQIPVPDLTLAARWKTLGFDTARLSPLGDECWIYQGSLHLRVPLRLSAKLVVKGDCICPSGSIIRGDLKATGRLAIGEGSECRGNLVAGKSLYLGPHARFAGVVHAGAAVFLSQGVRGAADGALVAAYAGSSLYLEAGVTVQGKLSAGRHVQVVPPSFAEKWKRRYEFTPEAT